LKLLSGPPSVLIVLKPSIQVNHVPHRAPAKLDGRRPELEEEGHADAEIGSGLFLGEAADRGERQAGVVLHAAMVVTVERRRCA